MKKYKSAAAAVFAALVTAQAFGCSGLSDAAVITGRSSGGNIMRQTFAVDHEDMFPYISPAPELPEDVSLIGSQARPMIDVIDIYPRETTTVDPRTLDPNYKPPYDFSKPVPETKKPVTDDYFADALFIGDSRTEGMRMYGKVKSYYYSKVALTVGGVLTQKIIYDAESDEKLTIIDTVRKYADTFKKVYINFGLNECAGDIRTLRRKYEQVLLALREVLPDAPIYVMAVLPITQKAADSSRYGISNARIDAVNEMLTEMCADGEYFYLAINEPFKDEETGELNAEDTNDGIHMGSPGVAREFDYLRSHTVDFSAWDWGEEEEKAEPAVPSEDSGG